MGTEFAETVPVGPVPGTDDRLFTMPRMGIEILLAVAASALSSGAVASAVRAFIRRDVGDVALSVIDDNDVDEALVALRERLVGGPAGDGAPRRASSALSPGELEAQAILSVYARELSVEAQRVAKRAKSERPSKDHVRQAADRIGILRDRAGVATDFALALGSILVGAAVSFQVNLWTGGQPADGIGPWMAITLAVGVGIVVAAGVIKWRRV